MLPSSGRSIGEQSVTTLPANRSIILADSRFRGQNILDTPYNFNCDLSGTGIYSKELYYQKLFWNQPLFSHNNASCELRFQVNGDDLTTYIVYVTPFTMFQQYDGNAPGTSLLTPLLYSYAANMEAALNGDIRTYPLNTTLVNGDGKIRDPTAPGHSMTIRFRYSPTKGFCCFPLQDSPTAGYYYSIRFLPCSYISKAHFVHGFGVYDPNVTELEYVPHSFFSSSIWSDCSPNLLPTRYIVIQSQELNKDRRLISFHNGNFANFVNELGIFSINPARTGIFHEVGVGDDATVISLRDDYTPQSFRIQILDEFGVLMLTSDPLSAVLQSSAIPPEDAYSFIQGALQGRGNFNFINFLVFGYQRIYNGVSLVGNGTLNSAGAFPLAGMKGATLSNQTFDYGVFNVAENVNLTLTIPLWLTSTSLTPSPVPVGLGFGTSTALTAPFLNNSAVFGSFTMFRWYPSMNRDFTIQWDFRFSTFITLNPSSSPSILYIIMFDANTFQPIAAAPGESINTGGIFAPIDSYGLGVTGWQFSPSYTFPPAPAGINVGFSLAWIVKGGTYVGSLLSMYPLFSPAPSFELTNKNDLLNFQADYLPPNDDSGEYDFGNPLANALPEEVIHEIAAILEYN